MNVNLVSSFLKKVKEHGYNGIAAPESYEPDVDIVVSEGKLSIVVHRLEGGGYTSAMYVEDSGIEGDVKIRTLFSTLYVLFDKLSAADVLRSISLSRSGVSEGQVKAKIRCSKGSADITVNDIDDDSIISTFGNIIADFEPVTPAIRTKGTFEMLSYVKELDKGSADTSSKVFYRIAEDASLRVYATNQEKYVAFETIMEQTYDISADPVQEMTFTASDNEFLATLLMGKDNIAKESPTCDVYADPDQSTLSVFVSSSTSKFFYTIGYSPETNEFYEGIMNFLSECKRLPVDVSLELPKQSVDTIKKCGKSINAGKKFDLLHLNLADKVITNVVSRTGGIMESMKISYDLSIEGSYTEKFDTFSVVISLLPKEDISLVVRKYEDDPDGNRPATFVSSGPGYREEVSTIFARGRE